jgi:hypothetical protein
MAMHLLQVLVHRTERQVGDFGCSQAQVAVAALDLFQALERTIKALQVDGWYVDDLEKFTIGVKKPTPDMSPLARELLAEANSEGIAWKIEPRDEDSPSYVTEGSLNGSSEPERIAHEST